MNLILLGPPGAGKGTQATSIVKEYGVVHISTGDIFRANLKAETELGKKAKTYMDAGQLVPDSLTVDLVKDRLSQEDVKQGFLLDGFPRNLFQAEALDEILKESGQVLTKAINIEVNPEILVGRISGRRICRVCGASYHVQNHPPKTEGVCDLDGGELYQRSDDNETTVKERIAVYEKETSPLVDYYTKQNKILTVNGEKDINEVFEDIKKDLGSGK